MDRMYLTVAQAAERLDMSPASVRRLASSGALQIWRIDAGRYLIVTASVDQYLATRRNPNYSTWSRRPTGSPTKSPDTAAPPEGSPTPAP